MVFCKTHELEALMLAPEQLRGGLRGTVLNEIIVLAQGLALAQWDFLPLLFQRVGGFPRLDLGRGGSRGGDSSAAQ